MKKRGIRIFIALILALALSIGATIPISAQKPAKDYTPPSVKAYVDVVSIVPGSSITFNYGWNKLGVHIYCFFFYRDGQTLGSTYGYPLGDDRVTYFESQETINASNYPCVVDQFVPGYKYEVTMFLYNRNHDLIDTFSDSIALP